MLFVNNYFTSIIITSTVAVVKQLGKDVLIGYLGYLTGTGTFNPNDPINTLYANYITDTKDYTDNSMFGETVKMSMMIQFIALLLCKTIINPYQFYKVVQFVSDIIIEVAEKFISFLVLFKNVIKKVTGTAYIGLGYFSDRVSSISFRFYVNYIMTFVCKTITNILYSGNFSITEIEKIYDVATDNILNSTTTQFNHSAQVLIQTIKDNKIINATENLNVLMENIKEPLRNLITQGFQDAKDVAQHMIETKVEQVQKVAGITVASYLGSTMGSAVKNAISYTSNIANPLNLLDTSQAANVVMAEMYKDSMNMLTDKPHNTKINMNKYYDGRAEHLEDDDELYNMGDYDEYDEYDDKPKQDDKEPVQQLKVNKVRSPYLKQQLYTNVTVPYSFNIISDNQMLVGGRTIIKITGNDITDIMINNTIDSTINSTINNIKTQSNNTNMTYIEYYYSEFNKIQTDITNKIKPVIDNTFNVSKSIINITLKKLKIFNTVMLDKLREAQYAIVDMVVNQLVGWISKEVKKDITEIEKMTEEEKIKYYENVKTEEEYRRKSEERFRIYIINILRVIKECIKYVYSSTIGQVVMIIQAIFTDMINGNLEQLSKYAQEKKDLFSSDIISTYMNILPQYNSIADIKDYMIFVWSSLDCADEMCSLWFTEKKTSFGPSTVLGNFATEKAINTIYWSYDQSMDMFRRMTRPQYEKDMEKELDKLIKRKAKQELKQLKDETSKLIKYDNKGSSKSDNSQENGKKRRID